MKRGFQQRLCADCGGLFLPDSVDDLYCIDCEREYVAWLNTMDTTPDAEDAAIQAEADHERQWLSWMR
jgi:ribosomal protein S27AE